MLTWGLLVTEQILKDEHIVCLFFKNLRNIEYFLYKYCVLLCFGRELVH